MKIVIILICRVYILHHTIMNLGADIVKRNPILRGSTSSYLCVNFRAVLLEHYVPFGPPECVRVNTSSLRRCSELLRQPLVMDLHLSYVS